MNQESKRFLKQVTIEEYYSKEDGIVYYNYRIAGRDMPWQRWKTALTDFPFVVVINSQMERNQKYWEDSPNRVKFCVGCEEMERGTNEKWIDKRHTCI